MEESFIHYGLTDLVQRAQEKGTIDDPNQHSGHKHD